MQRLEANKGLRRLKYEKKIDVLTAVLYNYIADVSNDCSNNPNDTT